MTKKTKPKPNVKGGDPIFTLFHYFNLRMKTFIASIQVWITTYMSLPLVQYFFLPGFTSAAVMSSGASFAGGLLGNGTAVIDPRRDASAYTLENSVVCPTITVGAGIFAGNGNQWGNNDIPYNSASGGGSNLGGVAGITIPLGGSLTEYCRSHAKMRSAITKLELGLSERKVAINFLEQCFWVQSYFPGYSKEEFRDFPQFKIFQSCPSERSRNLAAGVPLDATTQQKEDKPVTTPPKNNALGKAPILELRPPASASPVQVIQ